jgi:hypothetical protein
MSVTLSCSERSPAAENQGAQFGLADVGPMFFSCPSPPVKRFICQIHRVLARLLGGVV